MTIRVVCKKCHSKLDIRAELAGTTRKCPKCKTEFVVPQPADEAAEADTQALPAASETPAELATAEVARTEAELGAADPPLVSPEKSSPAAVKPDDSDEDQDDDEDFMPSFMTAAGDDKPDSKVGRASTPKPADEDEPVLSIPKTPLASKPKFKTFDPDDFMEEESPRPKKREMPASLEDDRRKRNPPDDDDFDEPPSRRGKGGGRIAGKELNLPTPESTGLSDSDAGMMSGGTKDRAQAARELRQALKDSALKVPVQTESTRGFDIDFAGLWSEFGIKGLALVAGVVILFPCIVYLSNSMMGSGFKLPKLGYVTGKVTYNGEPVPGAQVFFEPRAESGEKLNKVRTSNGLADEKGEYKLMYVEGVPGVAVGKSRVWLQFPPPLIVPGDFSIAGTTMKDVAAGSQKIDFELTGPLKKP